MTQTLVYSFAEADPGNKSLFGGKGAGLSGMTQLNLPVPHGFILTTDACRKIMSGDFNLHIDSPIMEEVSSAIHKLEAQTGLTFGQDLLVSVRSGAPVSMPGMMDTILNLGAHDDGEKSFRRWAGFYSRIWDELEDTWIDSPVDAEMLWLRVRKQFMVQMGKVALGLEGSNRLAKPEAMYKTQSELPSDAVLDVGQYREMVDKIYLRICKAGHQEVIDDPWTQLRYAIGAVFNSWNGHKAQAYRAHHGIDPDMGTAVNIVMMVYGNLNDDSGTGVMFTRDPATGDNRIYGEYLPNAQGEAVVSGEQNPQPIGVLKASNPAAFNDLVQHGKMLEKLDMDVQDIEFTIQAGELFLLQHRSAKRTARAALVSAMDMVDEGMISQEEAITRIPLEVLNLVGKPMFDAPSSYVLGKGLPASPGVVTGAIAYSSKEAVWRSDAGMDVVLVREFTSTEDIEGMLKAKAIVTGTGGLTCHAAVVSRDLGIACVVGCSAVNSEGQLLNNGVPVHAGEPISVNGHTGEVLIGKHVTVMGESSDPYTERFRDWVGDIEIIPGVGEESKTHSIGVYEIPCGLTPQLEKKARNEKGWWDELILSLDLSKLCADFYLLDDLTMRNPELIGTRQDYSEVLARQLAVYMDAACGGEARHAKDGFKTLTKTMSRALARKDWRVIRQKEGIKAMQDLEDAFFTQDQWGGAIGGKNWGRAAQLLNRLLTCQISPTTFIDMAFDLEHNTGCLFNKLTGSVKIETSESVFYGWNISGLTKVLNLKFEKDQIEAITQLGSAEMRSLFETYTPGDTIVVDGLDEAKASLKHGVVFQADGSGTFTVDDITVGSTVKVKMNSKVEELRGKIGTVVWKRHVASRGLSVKVLFDTKSKSAPAGHKIFSAYNVELLVDGAASVIEGPYRAYF